MTFPDPLPACQRALAQLERERRRALAQDDQQTGARVEQLLVRGELAIGRIEQAR